MKTAILKREKALLKKKILRLVLGHVAALVVLEMVLLLILWGI